ncbi:hypothetical protein [Schlesneria paludicola]|nr:hypothetical protein [Schlesneria paludicola]
MTNQLINIEVRELSPGQPSESVNARDLHKSVVEFAQGLEK